MKYGYLAVEGPHDVAFAGRLLKIYGLDRVKLFVNLDPFWRALVPRTYPHNDDLLKRVPVPVFFRSDTHSIAVHSVEGETGFAKTLMDSLDTIYVGHVPQLIGLGILLDADSKQTAATRASELKASLDKTEFPLKLLFPAQAGVISTDAPHCGIFVLPDNQNSGTLESLLIDAAKVVYPTLEAAARQYLSAVPEASELNNNDRKEFGKPAGYHKALVSCISAVLRPGKAIQVSLQDNRWLEEPLARVPGIAAVQDFLVKIFELA